MDAVLLSRIQFAVTVGFHFIFPPLTIGLAWFIYLRQPLCSLVPASSMIALFLAGYWITSGQARTAFIASMATIALIIASVALALYPTLVPASGHPEWSLTIANSSSW